MEVLRLKRPKKRLLTKVGSETPFEFGNVYKTYGGTDYAAPVGGIPSLNGATQASIHCRIKVSSGKFAIIGSTVSSNNRFELMKHSNNMFYISCSNGPTCFASIDFTPYFDLWTSVSVVLDTTKTGNSNKLICKINDTPQSLNFTGTVPNSLSNSIGSNFNINKLALYNIIGTSEYTTIVATNDASTDEQMAAFYNDGNGAFPEDCFTNIIANPDTNQQDGATVMPGRLGTPDFQLYNSSTPPAYFVPKT